MMVSCILLWGAMSFLILRWSNFWFSLSMFFMDWISSSSHLLNLFGCFRGIFLDNSCKYVYDVYVCILLILKYKSLFFANSLNPFNLLEPACRFFHDFHYAYSDLLRFSNLTALRKSLHATKNSCLEKFKTKLPPCLLDYREKNFTSF
jgi:hypothetical protein